MDGRGMMIKGGRGNEGKSQGWTGRGGLELKTNVVK